VFIVWCVCAGCVMCVWPVCSWIVCVCVCVCSCDVYVFMSVWFLTCVLCVWCLCVWGGICVYLWCVRLKSVYVC